MELNQLHTALQKVFWCVHCVQLILENTELKKKDKYTVLLLLVNEVRAQTALIPMLHRQSKRGYDQPRLTALNRG